MRMKGLVGCLCAMWFCGVSMAASQSAVVKEATYYNKMKEDTRCQQWVDSVMKRLSLRERVGQLFVYTIAPHRDKANRELLRKVVEDYKVGGLLFSEGTIQDQVMLTNEAQRQADVPLMITLDGEWGLAMRLKNTPRFPKNMALGCIQNDSLLYAYGREVARECKEMGIHVNFAPDADVNINPENPVINTRSFGENPIVVANKVLAYARGLEDGGVLSVSKHFPGHGDTNVDSHKSLPTLNFTRERLDSVELYPFRKAVEAGLNGIMVGHLSVPVLEPDKKRPSSLSRNIVHGLLEEELGFKGLIFTDALAMKGVSGFASSVCLEALKAGNDVLLVPRRIKEEVDAVLAAIKHGELSEEDINRRCRKVLMYKYALGLSKKPFIQLSGLGTRINTPAARDLVRDLNLAAVTVLGNAEQTLPMDRSLGEVAVLTVGNKSLQPFLTELSHYVQPVQLPLRKNLSAVEAEQLYARLSKYKRVVVCVTDEKVAAYRDFLAKWKPKSPVVYVFFTYGKTVTALEQAVKKGAATVLAHQVDNDDLQQHVARLLYGDAGADGRLSASIGDLYKAGEGVTLVPHALPRFIPDEHGLSSRILLQIDEIAREGIEKRAYPGCQIMVLKEGRIMYDKTFGTHTWGIQEAVSGGGKASMRPVMPDDVYDLASLSKAVGTTLALMKLYDRGLLSLTDRIGTYLPYLKGTDKANLTIRELLLHESGLPSTVLFYQDAIRKDSYRGALFSGRPGRLHTVRIGRQTWANPNFRFRTDVVSSKQTDSCSVPLSAGLWVSPSFRQEMLQKIADTPLRTKRYRYSCVGFVLLQQVVEARAGMPLDEYLAQEFYKPMGLTCTGYKPYRTLSMDKIVPSSVDDFLRKATLQGYVHDETAAFMGGVAGNAGLFSCAGEVARICQMLLNGGVLDGKRYLSQETCRLFTSKASRISRRALGFDMADPAHPKNNPCSTSAPASVYGHTGFTGTCAWIDPANQLVYVFLSNRIYPDSWNSKLMVLEIRERIQETIYKALVRS